MKRKKQILIVEDNEINREMLRVILDDSYEVLEAENGRVALDILEKKKEQITIILLDLIMPVMDGYEFMKEVKKDPEMALIPIIVMTQGSSEADEVSALSHGANDFIPKPYRPQIIKHRVASLIKLRETAAMVNLFQYDHITGLYTKEFFYRKAKERLDENPEKSYTILCCNLENFKLYNDTFGRKAGDDMLVEEAKMLKSRVSPDAICCRYSADRFLCLTDSESERIGREAFKNARRNGHSELLENMTVKIGVYEVTDHTVPVELMCDRALWVVDTIKGIYDQNVAVYDDTLRDKLIRVQAITDAMETALSEEQFVIYFQPKVDIKTDTLVGAEALVRWIHPRWGFMSPGEFIPLFEKNGFIRRLDNYVWRKTCEKLKEWSDMGLKVVPVSVNVSRADVFKTQLSETFTKLVGEYGVAPSLLHLEITESAYTDNPDQIITTVDELRGCGFVIEMDDFGSGYSSLNMLSSMTIDILKMDMGFIRNELAKPSEKCIIGDVINMAHRMQLKVVAEGVETEEQKDRLKAMNCDYVQGYFYSKPLPAEQFEEKLHQIR